MDKIKTAEERFSETYITSSEIIARLNITRSSIMYGKRKGFLPDAIEIGGTQTCLWERKTIEPYLAAWEHMLKIRRANHGKV